jgi:hypothetical protein
VVRDRPLDHARAAVWGAGLRGTARDGLEAGGGDADTAGQLASLRSAPRSCRPSSGSAGQAWGVALGRMTLCQSSRRVGRAGRRVHTLQSRGLAHRSAGSVLPEGLAEAPGKDEGARPSRPLGYVPASFGETSCHNGAGSLHHLLRRYCPSFESELLSCMDSRRGLGHYGCTEPVGRTRQPFGWVGSGG